MAVALPGTPSVSIAEATHGLATDRLLVTVYDDSIPSAQVAPELVTVHPTTHEVLVTFGTGQLGTVVLNGSSGVSLRSLSAHVQGLGTTADVAAPCTPALRSGGGSSTSPPDIVTTTDHVVMAQVAGRGQTDTVPMILTALRSLTARVTSSSQTVLSAATILRSLALSSAEPARRQTPWWSSLAFASSAAVSQGTV